MPKQLLSPYFQSLARQRRLCPECCRGELFVTPTLNPNAAWERCPRCDYSRVLAPPTSAAKVDWPGNTKEEVDAWMAVRYPDGLAREASMVSPAFLTPIARMFRKSPQLKAPTQRPKPAGRIIKADFNGR